MVLDFLYVIPTNHTQQIVIVLPITNVQHLPPLLMTQCRKAHVKLNQFVLDPKLIVSYMHSKTEAKNEVSRQRERVRTWWLRRHWRQST